MNRELRSDAPRALGTSLGNSEGIQEMGFSPTTARSGASLLGLFHWNRGIFKPWKYRFQMAAVVGKFFTIFA
ncbi:MAG: hypothetical protein WCB94_05105 [Terriglobales bacterium]